MNLKEYEMQESAWMDIISPDGTEVVAQFEIAGRDSKVLKRRQAQLAKKRQAKRKISAAEEEADTIETLAVCTLNWRDVDEEGEPKEDGYIINGKEKIECTADSAKAIYNEHQWIAEQVVEFLAERANFLAK